MNVFTTDHPMVREPSPALLRLQRRLLKAFLGVLLGYPLYLFLLGPFWELNGTGRLDFLPQIIRGACFLPSAPVYLFPGLRGDYYDYLDWWYHDPTAADPETGWR